VLPVIAETWRRKSRMSMRYYALVRGMGGSDFPVSGLLLRLRPKDVAKLPTAFALELLGRAQPSSRAALRAGSVVAPAVGKSRPGDWESDAREGVNPRELLRPAL